MLLRKLSILAALLITTGCDFGSGSEGSTTQNLPAGARILSVSGRVHDTTGNVRIQLGNKVVKPAADGSYSIQDTVIVRRAAGRTLADTVADTTIRDTARILVVTTTKTDTLREVPLTSWSNLLSPVSVVANDVSVNAATGSKISGKIIEAVWWSDDTIAHVQRVPNSTSSDYFSTTIYSLYNDSLYAVNGRKFSIFLRAKNAVTDTVPLSFTRIRDIGAQNGALNYTDTFFRHTDRDSLVGVTLVPKDSNVVVFGTARNTLPSDSIVITSFKSIGATGASKNGPEQFVDTSGLLRNGARYTKFIVEFDLDTAAPVVVDFMKKWSKPYSEFTVECTASSENGGGSFGFDLTPHTRMRVEVSGDRAAAVAAAFNFNSAATIRVSFNTEGLQLGSSGMVKNLRIVAYK